MSHCNGDQHCCGNTDAGDTRLLALQQRVIVAGVLFAYDTKLWRFHIERMPGQV